MLSVGFHAYRVKRLVVPEVSHSAGIQMSWCLHHGNETAPYGD